jgi:hypothetical protein
MNSLYLILIGISFTAGVLVTSFGNENKANVKPVCEEHKSKIEEDLKVVTNSDINKDSWSFFEKR